MLEHRSAPFLYFSGGPFLEKRTSSRGSGCWFTGFLRDSKQTHNKIEENTVTRVRFFAGSQCKVADDHSREPRPLINTILGRRWCDKRFEDNRTGKARPRFGSVLSALKTHSWHYICHITKRTQRIGCSRNDNRNPITYFEKCTFEIWKPAVTESQVGFWGDLWIVYHHWLLYIIVKEE